MTLIDTYQRDTDGKEAYEKMLNIILLNNCKLKQQLDNHHTPIRMAKI